MRASNRLVRLCQLQDLIYMAACRAGDVGDFGRRKHLMDRYERIKSMKAVA